MGRVNLTKNDESLGAMPYQVFQPPGPKRAPPTQNINGLQQAGLAGGVGAVDEREMGIEIEFRRLQAAEIRYLQPTQAHGL
jgi:hypothetical protein